MYKPYKRPVTVGCGLSKAHALSFDEKLIRCRNKILDVNEKRYNIKINESVSLEERNKNMVIATLEKAEQMLGINDEYNDKSPEDSDFFSRLYRVRHICWDRIYLPDTDNFDNLSKTKRSFLDISAGEAWYVARHQELADFGWYFYRSLPKKDSALYLKVEYVQNLWDYANRTMGGAISD